MNEAEYERLAAVEDTMWHFEALHGHVRRGLVRAGWRGTGSLLDAGCGTGGLLRRLRHWFPEADLQGVDASPAAVDWSRRRTQLPIQHASTLSLPFPDGAFDAITCVDVAIYWEQPGPHFFELARCLKPGGVLVSNEPAHHWLWSYHDVAVAARRRFRRAEIDGLLRGAGLVPLCATHWNALALPLVWLRRKILPPPASSSDVHAYGLAVSAMMRTFHALERLWLSSGATFPCGTSVLTVATKPLGSPARHVF